MKQVRIEPAADGCFFIDITCTCGRNGLQNAATFQNSFKHLVGCGGNEIQLNCECGMSYRLTPQSTHIHVAECTIPATEEISEVEWRAIMNTCSDCKWSSLIELFAADKNRPQDFVHANNWVAKKARTSKIYPAFIALTYLNEKMNKKGLPFRIKRVVKGKTPYEGEIQIVRI